MQHESRTSAHPEAFLLLTSKSPERPPAAKFMLRIKYSHGKGPIELQRSHAVFSVDADEGLGITRRMQESWGELRLPDIQESDNMRARGCRE